MSIPFGTFTEKDKILKLSDQYILQDLTESNIYV